MRSKIIYDGKCEFCERTIKLISLFSRNFEFDPKNDGNEVIYIENGKVYTGFYAIRKIALKIPFLWPFVLIFYFPFFDKIGGRIYKIISKYRKWI